MQLRPEEEIIRIYHHHYFPFIIRVFKVLLGSLPFFFVAYLFSPIMSVNQLIIVHIVLTVFFILVIIYVALIYWLDRLVITNQRVAHIDWKQLLVKDETAANLEDIQDILSEDKGIIANIPFFNYGSVKIQTASYVSAIIFIEAPDADGVKDFIYNVRRQTLMKK